MTRPTPESFIARHPIAIYCGLTFAISWGGALLAIGGSVPMRGTMPGSPPVQWV